MGRFGNGRGDAGAEAQAAPGAAAGPGAHSAAHSAAQSAPQPVPQPVPQPAAQPDAVPDANAPWRLDMVAGRLGPFLNQLRDYALYLLDADGRVRSWNTGAERLKGYSEADILGRHFSNFYPPEARAANRPAEALALAARDGSYCEEGIRVRQDGSRFWASIVLSALRDEHGVLQGYVKLARDISPRKHSEAALRESEARYRAMFEHSNDAMLLLEEEGPIVSANPAALRLFGYTEAEMLALGRDDVVDMSDPRVEPACATRERRGEADAVITFIRRGGERFEGAVSSSLFEDETGRGIASMVIQDVTRRRAEQEALRRSEARMRLLYDAAPLGIILVGLDGRCLFANRKFAEMSGYAQQELHGMDYLELTVPEERAMSAALSGRLFRGEIEAVDRERQLLCRDGGRIWVRLTAATLRGANGQPEHAIGVFEDITQRREAEAAARRSEGRFRAMFEHAPLGIAECALDGRYLNANPKLLDLLGYRRDEFIGLTVLAIAHPADQEDTGAALRRLAAGEVDSTVMEQRYVRRDRSFLWVKVTTALRRDDGAPLNTIAIVEDITERKKAQEDLRRAMEQSYHLANHDPLTGLANRAQFGDRLRDALAYGRRDEHMVALHLLDLDRFKSINDTLGHHIGDLLLRQVAERIRAHIRATDLAARLGGDEFVVIQTHLTDPQAAAALAGKLVDELGRPYMLEGHEVHSGASIGIALCPLDAPDGEQLMKLADLALYEAKSRGRYNFQRYREELSVAARDARQSERELRRALHDSQFRLHYQPQFDLRSGRIAGVEALLRWHHPQRGLLAAGTFIEEADQAGLMLPIGEWTLRTACHQHGVWSTAGFAGPLTVNVSARQLKHPGFLPLLRRLLPCGVQPGPRLQLEVRESLVRDPKVPDTLLAQLKQAGVALALDNFGSELTALSSLSRYPVDVVKPCSLLVAQAGVREPEHSVLAAIVGVAHGLRMAVCAEGVETAAAYESARRHGCDAAQGNLLSEPVDAERMSELIAADGA